jgi:hypothetical protein
MFIRIVRVVLVPEEKKESGDWSNWAATALLVVLAGVGLFGGAVELGKSMNQPQSPATLPGAVQPPPPIPDPVTGLIPGSVVPPGMSSSSRSIELPR